MLKSFFYVSVKTRPWPDDARDVEDIVAVSRERNARLDVTGALISADTHFAQIIEGSEAAINELAEAILADTRHDDVVPLDLPPHDTRWYPDWALAYQGPATFVSQRLAKLMGPSADPIDVTALLKLMRSFRKSH